MSVHVIEDDSGVRDSLVLLLRQLGYDPSSYADAESFMTGNVPAVSDTVIVDLGLPGMSGAHLLRWLQSLAEPPRVIVISGQSQAKLTDWLRGLNVPHLIRKPLSMDAIAPLL